jgi:hypothetical protein
MGSMKKWWENFYKENKLIVWAGVVAIVLTLGILWKVPDEVTRFTLIMPVFAGFILFAILTTEDEELEEEGEEKEPQKKSKKSTKR